jgi:hypothetical protein
MMRCRACNRVLTVFEMKSTTEDGDPEDLCATCRRTISDHIHMGEIRESDFFFDWDLPLEPSDDDHNK